MAVYTEVADEELEAFIASYDIGDHIHPNSAGVAVITGVMRAALERVPGALGQALR